MPLVVSEAEVAERDGSAVGDGQPRLRSVQQHDLIKLLVIKVFESEGIFETETASEARINLPKHLLQVQTVPSFDLPIKIYPWSTDA